MSANFHTLWDWGRGSHLKGAWVRPTRWFIEPPGEAVGNELTLGTWAGGSHSWGRVSCRDASVDKCNARVMPLTCQCQGLTAHNRPELQTATLGLGPPASWPAPSPGLTGHPPAGRKTPPEAGRNRGEETITEIKHALGKKCARSGDSGSRSVNWKTVV